MSLRSAREPGCRVTKLVELPALVAHAAYDAEVQPPAPGRRRFAIALPPARLSLYASHRAPWRGCHAVVSSGLLRWPAELELAQRSATHTELSLRLYDVGFLRRPPESIIATSQQLLTHLADTLMEWVEQPLRELVDTFDAAQVNAPVRVSR